MINGPQPSQINIWDTICSPFYLIKRDKSFLKPLTIGVIFSSIIVFLGADLFLKGICTLRCGSNPAYAWIPLHTIIVFTLVSLPDIIIYIPVVTWVIVLMRKFLDGGIEGPWRQYRIKLLLLAGIVSGTIIDMVDIFLQNCTAFFVIGIYKEDVPLWSFDLPLSILSTIVTALFISTIPAVIKYNLTVIGAIRASLRFASYGSNLSIIIILLLLLSFVIPYLLPLSSTARVVTVSVINTFFSLLWFPYAYLKYTRP